MSPNCNAEELARKRVQKEEFLLLDVRSPGEVAIVSLEGALCIPLDQLDQRLDELAPWKDKEVIAMCHHGVRSAAACRILRSAGFTRARNLSGGIDAYAVEVDSALPRY